MWLVYTDRSGNNSGAWLRCLIVKPTGKLIEKIVHLVFQASNNEADYEATIYALGEVQELGTTKV